MGQSENDKMESIDLTKSLETLKEELNKKEEYYNTKANAILPLLVGESLENVSRILSRVNWKISQQKVTL